MVKKEMLTTIHDLIQKLKGLDISTYAILELWESEFYDGEHDIYETYYKIYGLIWGLYSAGFITDYERDCLSKDLRKNIC